MNRAGWKTPTSRIEPTKGPLRLVHSRKEVAMEPTVEKLRILETLVEELLKDDPEEKVVVQCMTKAGIHDSKDPIDRINKVLMALHFEDTKKEIVE